MSSFWDTLGQRLNDGTLKKSELESILGDLHTIDHATDEALSYVLYKAHPNWTRRDPELRGRGLFLSEETVKKLLAEHHKIHERNRA